MEQLLFQTSIQPSKQNLILYATMFIGFIRVEGLNTGLSLVIKFNRFQKVHGSPIATNTG